MGNIISHSIAEVSSSYLRSFDVSTLITATGQQPDSRLRLITRGKKSHRLQTASPAQFLFL